MDRVGGRVGGNLSLTDFPLRFCDDLACKKRTNFTLKKVYRVIQNHHSPDVSMSIRNM